MDITVEKTELFAQWLTSLRSTVHVTGQESKKHYCAKAFNGLLLPGPELAVQNLFRDFVPTYVIKSTKFLNFVPETLDIFNYMYLHVICKNGVRIPISGKIRIFPEIGVYQARYIRCDFGE